MNCLKNLQHSNIKVSTEIIFNKFGIQNFVATRIKCTCYNIYFLYSNTILYVNEAGGKSVNKY